MRSAFGTLNCRLSVSRSQLPSASSGYLSLPSAPSPNRPVSSERNAFCSASLNVRPMAIASPTLFICVVNTGSAPGNFSKVKRGIFTTQ